MITWSNSKPLASSSVIRIVPPFGSESLRPISCGASSPRIAWMRRAWLFHGTTTAVMPSLPFASATASRSASACSSSVAHSRMTGSSSARCTDEMRMRSSEGRRLANRSVIPGALR